MVLDLGAGLLAFSVVPAACGVRYQSAWPTCLAIVIAVGALVMVISVG